MPGLEATTLMRRAFGSGQTARPGMSHSGHRVNRPREMKTACTMCSIFLGIHILITSGTIGTATAGKLISCAARRFAQVKVIKMFSCRFLVFFFQFGERVG